jgi:hypothetical protein
MQEVHKLAHTQIIHIAAVNHEELLKGKFRALEVLFNGNGELNHIDRLETEITYQASFRT